ncbi:hypothetical protein LAUMK4_05873 [Mycobacterium persicum]|uniref:Single-stranded DNA-binding protein n=1 Tax=Mycobacterium persicum TaxID=1487726 RepID=A0ABY6RSN0_9MYCO|nr:hypothetical protein [Mycobacterium persicum]ORB93984.1 hypothetical protein B1T44_04945 [Mycobacterium persicum]VAZ77514.1 hypothetical protein LAUMK15_03878 [Mycobacterium persicum]VBA33098.1 hypothetical protein LAUMK4_05873 [Mycobacterium persicum]
MKPEDDSLKALRQPFPPEQIGKLPKGGISLDFVGHGYLTARFLDVDPHWNWEPLAVGANGLPVFDEHGGLWIRLTIAGVTRLGYGDAGGKKGPNAVKEAIGDALRNAGMRFGAALDLWCKGDPDAPQPPSREEVERAEAIAELGDACMALGLDERETAGKFYSTHKRPVRQATAQQIRAFIKSLHDEAEKAS